jgi:hypothetical protein
VSGDAETEAAEVGGAVRLHLAGSQFGSGANFKVKINVLKLAKQKANPFFTFILKFGSIAGK